MQIARDRAKVMAANDMLSHTEPNGTKVYDRLSADAIQWYAAGEIISYRFEPAMYDAVNGTIAAWMASSGHRAIMLSTNYNYVGYGAAVSASGKRYFAGVFVKQRDKTGAWAKFGSVTRRSVDARPRAGHDPLDGCRHPPPGPDRRVALLRGPGQAQRD